MIQIGRRFRKDRTALMFKFYLGLALLCILAACQRTSWRDDPGIEAVRIACKTQQGVDDTCVEQKAVSALNPEICRLVGISIDDMCLQAVYEAAGDPAICDRIYLQGVVPNCRAYYARIRSKATQPVESSQAPRLTQTSPALIVSPTLELTPTWTPLLTSPSTPEASATPAIVFDLSGYDPDLHPPIDIYHNLPLIARSDETVSLVFDFANMICFSSQVSCTLKGDLFYQYGEIGSFQTIPLENEIVDELDSLVARLPATDQDGKSLRYYAEFTVPEAGYAQRYPGAGTIDLFATEKFIAVELPVENAAAPGEKVYDFFWGFGPDKVRQAAYDNYPQRVGPPAMDVAADGQIALMDPVNERIILFDPVEGSYSNLPMPFTYQFWGDVAFDENSKLVVCDWLGEETEGSIVSIPYCYRLLPDGRLDESAPVYVQTPAKISKYLKVLDYRDGRLVAPFDSQGKANSREEQRERENWDFPLRFVEGKDPYVAHFADVKESLAFEVQSVSPLGAITEFAKTPQGYLMTFLLGDRIRAVWIDSSGRVLKDVTLPNSQHTEINFNGQVAVAEDGSLYVLNSTERGIEIHYVGAP
jgi:hypothetical protein